MNKLYKNENIFLFLLLFFIFFTFGLSFAFLNEVILNKSDIIFQLDSFSVYPYFWNTFISTSKLITHPLVLIIVHPILNAINILFHSQLASTLALQACLASVNACFIYKIIKLISKSDKFAVFGSLIYAFSFSTILFTSVPENYIFGAFFNILLLYYVCVNLNTKNSDLTIKDFFIMSFLIAMSCGFILICVVQNVILVAYLLYKKYGFNSRTMISLLKIISFVLLMVVGLWVMQNYAYGILKFPSIEMIQRDQIKYLNLISEDKLYYFIRGSFILPFYAVKYVGRICDYMDGIYAFEFVKDGFFQHLIPVFVFLTAPLLYYCKKIKVIKNNNIISILLFLFLLNLVYNYIYDSAECYIFAQNFLPYLIVALMLIMANSKSIFFEIICKIFLSCQMIINIITFCKLESILKIEAEKYCGIFFWLGYSCVITLIFALFIFILRRIIKETFYEFDVNKKYFILTVSYLAYIIVCALFYAMFACWGF